jgi:ketosteroid isomerase-like protein
VSQENVEIVRRWWTSLEAGELPFDLTDENVRIDNIEQPVVQGAFHGHDGLRRWWQDFAEAFEDIHFEVLDYTALDAERVLTENRSQGHFRETGLPLDLRWASIFSVRNGKVVHATGYLSAREALEAAGLSEQDAHANS